MVLALLPGIMEDDSFDSVEITREDVPPVGLMLMCYIERPPKAGVNPTYYKISCSSGTNEWTVLRRYSEFEHFRAILQRALPNVDVPKLPSKGISLWRPSNDQAQLDERTKRLNVFLKELSSFDGAGVDLFCEDCVLSFFDVCRGTVSHPEIVQDNPPLDLNPVPNPLVLSFDESMHDVRQFLMKGT
eukprot:TRINITY_DN67284_c12_g1_i1.p1 TRINITY_DN67284_c12_g1~~TRINITY_DN67284_c12_g1_i1.p1  ORF type:complete len:187 (+),score=5.04 TRINITY_DN67284_c12_g1_i1:74-634(+)